MFWKGKSVEIAASEQLYGHDKLNLNLLFERAKAIYDTGYEKGLPSWDSPWKTTKEEEILTKKEEVKKHEKTEKKEGMKTCPECGEQVPATWTVHSYKKDGTPCGHKFCDKKENGKKEK